MFRRKYFEKRTALEWKNKKKKSSKGKGLRVDSGGRHFRMTVKRYGEPFLTKKKKKLYTGLGCTNVWKESTVVNVYFIGIMRLTRESSCRILLGYRVRFWNDSDDHQTAMYTYVRFHHKVTARKLRLINRTQFVG